MIRKLFGGFDKMLCCSETCERRDRCAKHIKNVNEIHVNIPNFSK